MIEKKAPLVRTDDAVARPTAGSGDAGQTNKNAVVKSAVVRKNRRGVIDNVKHDKRAEIAATRVATAREDKIKNQQEFRRKAEEEERRLSEQRSKAYDEIGEDNVAAHQSPISLVVLLIVGLVVSLVDVTFLKDVFGRILDLEDSFAYLIAIIVGLAAASFMAMHGYKNSHSRIYRNWDSEKVVWLALGIILFIMRIVSGYIIEIDPTVETLFLNTHIRVADMVIAPVMLMFYFGSGSLVSYCVEHIYATGIIENWAKRRNIAKLTRRYAHDDKVAKSKAIRERKQDLINKMVDRKFAAKLDKQHRKDYVEALAKYNKVLDEVHREYDRISDAVAGLEHYEQRVEQTKLARDRLIDNVENSKMGAQNEVAMLIHSKTGTQVETLQGIIDTYNANYRRRNQDKKDRTL